MSSFFVVNFENLATRGLFRQFLTLFWQKSKRNIPVFISIIDISAVAEDLWMMLFQAFEVFGSHLFV